MSFGQQLFSFGSQSVEDDSEYDLAALADEAFDKVVQELHKVSLL